MDNMSLSDIAAVTRDKDNWTDGGIWILILLLALGGGGLWNRGGIQQDAVTQAGLCNAMNFNNLENLVGRLSDQNNNQTAIIGNGLSDLGYTQLGQTNNLEKTVMQGNFDISRQVADCCCKTQTSIAENKYAMEKGFCGLTSTINDKFAQLEKQQLEQRISQLENQNQMMFIAQQMSNVVRYPNGYTWDAGTNPFCCKTTTTTPATGA